MRGPASWLAARRSCARLDREIAAQRFFTYARVGIEQRTIELLPDHRIGRGLDRLEQRWTMRPFEGKPHLGLEGGESTICRLALADDGTWRGRWLLHEKNEVILRPAAPPSFGPLNPSGVCDHPMFRKAQSLKPAYEVKQLYRRTVAGHPELKQLVKVDTDKAAPAPFGRAAGQLCDDVLFASLCDPPTGRAFWAKRYSSDWAKQLPLELDFYTACGDLDARAVFPVDFTAEHGLIFDFDPGLFAGSAVHLYDIGKHFSAPECAEIRAFADTIVRHPRLGENSIARLADFQTVATPRGLRFIDFAMRPEHWWML